MSLTRQVSVQVSDPVSYVAYRLPGLPLKGLVAVSDRRTKHPDRGPVTDEVSDAVEALT